MQKQIRLIPDSHLAIILRMKPTLYFLRSSEQKIVTDMLYYAARLDEVQMTLDDLPALSIYERLYGLNHTDIGVYALVGHKLAGAAWIRLLQKSDHADAYVDPTTPILTIAIRPEFRGQGIGSAILDQLFQEAGAIYDQMSVRVVDDPFTLKFFKDLGFVPLHDSEGRSPVDDAKTLTMLKRLSRQEVERPSDGYDPTYWMD